MEKESTSKQKGHMVWVRKLNPTTGKVEDRAYWVDGEEVFAIEKEDPETGEWKPVVRVVPDSEQK